MPQTGKPMKLLFSGFDVLGGCRVFFGQNQQVFFAMRRWHCGERGCFGDSDRTSVNEGWFQKNDVSFASLS